MNFAKGRINLKQGCIISVAVNNFEEPFKQTEGAPKAELVINAVPISGKKFSFGKQSCFDAKICRDAIFILSNCSTADDKLFFSTASKFRTPQIYSDWLDSRKRYLE